MSGSNKKSTFLTESSNLDEPKNEGDLRQEQQQEENSVKNDESITNDEDEDDYMDNTNADNDEEDDDIDEESDAYPNPFSQHYSLFSNPHMIKEEKEDDEITYDENLPPISALAPEVMHQDEAQVEVSSTPAFQCLEEVKIKLNLVKSLFFILFLFFFEKLFQKGKLTGTQVAQLKAKYIELHSTLKKY